MLLWPCFLVGLASHAVVECFAPALSCHPAHITLLAVRSSAEAAAHALPGAPSTSRPPGKADALSLVTRLSSHLALPVPALACPPLGIVLPRRSRLLALPVMSHHVCNCLHGPLLSMRDCLSRHMLQLAAAPRSTGHGHRRTELGGSTAGRSGCRGSLPVPALLFPSVPHVNFSYRCAAGKRTSSQACSLTDRAITHRSCTATGKHRGSVTLISARDPACLCLACSCTKDPTRHCLMVVVNGACWP